MMDIQLHQEHQLYLKELENLDRHFKTARVHMELDLKSFFGHSLYSMAETPHPPPPRIRAHMRGRYLSAKIDDISFK
jgi:hypothetical protein